MMDGRKPDIVCIGAQKSGTSWLHEVLATREDVWVPPFKELHFFDYKFIEECRRWAPWHVRKGVKQAKERHLAQELNPNQEYLAYLDKLVSKPILNGTWYKYVFSQSKTNEFCLDVTPEYSCLPNEGVEFFKNFLPQVKLIYIIRHPLDRMVSQIRMNAARRKSKPLLQDDWNELLAQPALHSRGDYKSNVATWDAHFGPDQLLFLPYGEISRRPHQLLKTIEDHCGLLPSTYHTAQKRVHVTPKVTLPDFVRQQLCDVAKEQSEFVKERFGAEFLEKTQ